MKKSRSTESQIVGVLKQVAGGRKEHEENGGPSRVRWGFEKHRFEPANAQAPCARAGIVH